jgi:predicted RecA/RadA family phage recombinase
MKNPKRDGKTFEFVVASTARVAGTLDCVGNIVGIHAKDAAIGETAVLMLEGVYRDILKVTTDVVAAGDPLYFDIANAGGGSATARLTKALGGSGVNRFAGVADIAAGNGVTKVDLILGKGSQTVVQT